MRAADLIPAFLTLCASAAPAAAAQTHHFDIPAGRLGDALIALARQADITIGAVDPGLAGVRTPPVRGTMTAESALARLLAGTGYGFELVGPGSVRIRRTAPPLPRPAPPLHPPRPALAPAPLPVEDIVVTGSKMETPLSRFGGTVDLVELAPAEIGRFGARGSEAVVDRLPMLASTNLGPGRNKIYIRGIADSSFNGPSQSVVGQYLGDVRLTFNAPDPDLHLYDVARVEVLEGPQGTLYGSGSLGGILRLVPNPPDPAAASAGAAAGVLVTEHGGLGSDVAGMVNLPVTGRLALRVVGYASVDPGYIDDAGRRLHDVNRSNVHGGRMTLLWTPGGGWQIEAGALAQYITDRDGQYALRALPPLTRTSALAQPFDNDYRLAHITVRKSWAGAELVSGTGLVRHSLDSDFDATGFPGTAGPQLFNEDVEITLFTHETRLSHRDSRGGGWLAGLSLVRDVSRIRRRLGPPGSPAPLSGVLNTISEAALFGQFSLAPTDSLVLAVGGRLNLTETQGRPLDAPDEEAEEPKRTDFQLLPSASVTWQAAPRLLAYAHVQRGYRAGGLAVSGTRALTSVQRFESDSLTSYEAGLRFGGTGSPLRFEAAASYARWADIQADLIDGRGLPFTANLGDGRIYGLEAKAAWQATPHLALDAAAFVNRSHLTDPNPPFTGAADRDLPNVAGRGARAAAHWRAPLSPALALGIDAALRYVGESSLGVSEPLNLEQGRYAEAQLGARLDFGRFGISLDVDNLTDTRGNRFAFGNPFTVADGQQITPLRPRTVRLGFDAAF